MRSARTVGALSASALAVLGACGSRLGSRAVGPPTEAGRADSTESSGGESSGESGAEPSDAGDAGVATGGGFCTARGDAASCPQPPPGFDFQGSLGGTSPGYWVGCESTLCSSQTSCTTCVCEVGDGGGVWACSSNSGFQAPDGAPTPYCSLSTGPLDDAAGTAGSVTRCTTDYPTCTPPSPGQSPGWQCCQVLSVGGLHQRNCKPSHDGGLRLEALRL
ncbi:MAG TPA: hypothetical protein VKU41_24340 [Polyangiaceae bacterium]|nr:hypothetical protein [Polyangiaceae bacterium]